MQLSSNQKGQSETTQFDETPRHTRILVDIYYISILEVNSHPYFLGCFNSRSRFHFWGCFLLLILGGVSADASGDKSVDKYLETCPF